jgi:hypothetical protein
MTGRGPGTAAPVVEALGPSLVLAAGGGRWPTRWTAPGCWAEADDGWPGMLHGELRIRSEDQAASRRSAAITAPSGA